MGELSCKKTNIIYIGLGIQVLNQAKYHYVLV